MLMKNIKGSQKSQQTKILREVKVTYWNRIQQLVYYKYIYYFPFHHSQRENINRNIKGKY